MPEELPEKQSRTVWQELKESGLFEIGRVTLGIVAAYVILLLISLLILRDLGKLGEWGDSFGALTSLLNALAFAAVVATVVLQSRELRDSRRELTKQAVAQQAWAEAAAKQISLTERLESVRIRPFIKVEWEQLPGANYCSLWLRNVGLGVAIVTSVHLFSGKKGFGSVAEHKTAQDEENWTSCINDVLGTALKLSGPMQLQQFDDLNRALASNEKQIIATAVFGGISVASSAISALRQNFHPVITFLSASGEEWTTDNQFMDVRPVRVP